MTNVEKFLEVGKLLFPGEDWQAKYAQALAISPTRIRDVRRKKADLNRDGEKDRLLKDALFLAETELADAQRRMKNAKKAIQLLKKEN